MSTRVQALAMAGAPSVVHAEYPIPLGSIEDIPSTFASNKSRVYIDLLHEVTGEIWEIKPIYQEQDAFVISHGQALMMNELQRLELLRGVYPTGRPYNWNFSPVGWQQGTSFPRTPVFLGTDGAGYYSFYAKQGLPGTIVWWKVPNDPRRVQNPIYVPGIMLNPESATTRNTHPDRVFEPAYGMSVFPLNDSPVCTASCHVPGFELAPVSSAWTEASIQAAQTIYTTFAVCAGLYFLGITGGAGLIPAFAN